MYKVVLVGAFGFKEKYTGGQPVKSRNMYELVCSLYNKNEVTYVETIGCKRRPIRHLLDLTKKCISAENIIMMTAQNGVHLYPFILSIITRKRTKLFYCVIGGWLPQVVKKNGRLRKIIADCFSGIWVETESMREQLLGVGLTNVDVFPNFKFIKPLSELVPLNTIPPIRICTFSRVMKEKGISDAINAVKLVNERIGDKAFCLDIYGPIDASYKEEFESEMKVFPDYITYQGTVDSAMSVQILKDYNALLFPTYYEGEGFAGTLLDAMAAGVPVIASDWKYNKEILTNDIGLFFKTRDVSELIELLVSCYNSPSILFERRVKCLEHAAMYMPETLMVKLKSLMQC